MCVCVCVCARPRARITLLYYKHCGFNILKPAQSNTPTASLQSGKTLTNECSRYDIRKSNCEAPVMLEL